MWHVWGEKTYTYRISVVNSEGKIHLEDFGIDGMAVPEGNRVR